jgi:polysaccharide biosynthesis/export protein
MKRNKWFISPLCPAWLLLAGLNFVTAETTPSAIEYILGPSDQIVIRSVQAKEITDKQVRLEANGEVNLPLIGRVRLGGLSVPQAEAALTKAAEKYYIDPDIAVSVAEFRSEPVSIIGAVGAPGVHEARGRKTLLEMLSLAGGARPDAGPVVKITRQKQYGPIPLPGARDTGDNTAVAEIDLKSLLEARDPSENIVVRPNDVISIPRAEMVYVVGNVKRAGGIPLGGRSTISALEALSLAEGLDFRAAPGHARILRPSNRKPDAGREEIPIHLDRILSGKNSDIYLHPNDILFVPNSMAKSVTTRSLETALQIGTGILIWHH